MRDDGQSLLGLRGWTTASLALAGLLPLGFFLVFFPVFVYLVIDDCSRYHGPGPWYWCYSSFTSLHPLVDKMLAMVPPLLVPAFLLRLVEAWKARKPCLLTPGPGLLTLPRTTTVVLALGGPLRTAWGAVLLLCVVGLTGFAPFDSIYPACLCYYVRDLWRMGLGLGLALLPVWVAHLRATADVFVVEGSRRKGAAP